MTNSTKLLNQVLLTGMLIVLLPGVAAAKALPLAIGALPAPPRGAGPGKLMFLPLDKSDKPYTVKFGQPGTPSGNSFYVAKLRDRVFIPSAAGYTNVLNINTHKAVQRFRTLKGGRVAAISKINNLLFVLSANHLAAYSATDGVMRYEIDYGGNAMVLNNFEGRLFVGGNMNNDIAVVNAYTGEIIRKIPIGHSGDLAWANGFVFSADMKTGVMSAYNPATEKIYTMETPEADPNFNYHHIPLANAGFMQLAVSPDQHYVYAAGFSGHILRFSATTPAYLGEVTVLNGNTISNKLSGLAVLDNSNLAISTIENRHESVIVNLDNGHIIKRLPHVMSNRWLVTTS